MKKGVIDFMKKALLPAAIGTAMLVSSPNVYASRLENREIKEYTSSILETTMKRQENFLGIKHFGTPQLDFYEKKGLFSKKTSLGWYVLKSNKITMNLSNKEAVEYGMNSDGKRIYYNQDETLSHELAHYYCEKLSEKLNKGKCVLGVSDLNSRIICEGIARYFEETTGFGAAYLRIKESAWPKNQKELKELCKSKSKKDVFVYLGGKHIVKPLIDKYKEKAIEFLIYEPMKNNEILNYKSYQQRIENKILEKSKEACLK